MTPQLARLALCGFLCLAAGVASNALYFQQPMRGRVSAAPSPAPPAPPVDKKGFDRATWSPSKPASKSEERRSAPFQANSVKLEDPPLPGASDGRPETIRAVQRELKTRGYGPVAVDGVPGLTTRAAILAFETDEGLPLTGIANELLLKQILLGPSEKAAPGVEPGPRAQEVIRITQNWLLMLGYQAGPANGHMSTQTQGAIRAFEASQGLPQRGLITADLVTRLADAVPLKSPGR